MTDTCQIEVFLARAGYGAASHTPLPQDAGDRRYTRLTGGPHPAVLMQAPPNGTESVAAFLRIRADLATAGLSVPRLLAAEPAQGLLLLEDFGEKNLAAQLDSLSDPAPLLLAAAGTLGPLGRVRVSNLPAWNAAAMTAATEATFLDWWWPASFGVSPAPQIRAEFRDAMLTMLAPLDAGPIGFVHRDYFAANLFHLPARPGMRQIGLIDFQDAALGSPAYDLVSLTQDARRDLPADLTARAAQRLLAARPDLDPTDFDAALAVCAAQRHLRVAALWVRLHRRDGKPAYLAHGPRCWRWLATALDHPATAPLAAFLEHHVPPAMRGNPAMVPA